MTSLPSDRVLVAGLREGDEDVFSLVLRAWSPGMLRVARAFVGSHAVAEEAVQDTWLAVIQGIARFEGRPALKTWVYRILVNTAKKRGAKENRTVPMTVLASEAGPSVDPARFRDARDDHPGHWRDDRAPQPWPEDHALAGEVRQVIARALDALPARHRIVITLRDLEGYTADEVCGLLEISPGNQRVLLHRARAAVRGRLEEYYAAAGGGRAP